MIGPPQCLQSISLRRQVHGRWVHPSQFLEQHFRDLLLLISQPSVFLGVRRHEDEDRV